VESPRDGDERGEEHEHPGEDRWRVHLPAEDLHERSDRDQRDRVQDDGESVHAWLEPWQQQYSDRDDERRQDAEHVTKGGPRQTRGR
jgi:hypothetical protein